MLGRALEAGLESELIDVRDRIQATNNTEKSLTAQRLADKVKKANGFIIVSPEYNHGYPGELKMLLDMRSSQYAHKPLGICGVSSGPWGDARMVEQLRLVCIEFHSAQACETVYFPKVQELFGEDGSIKGRSQYRQAERLLSELIWYARL